MTKCFSKAASAEIPMLQVVSSLVALVVFPGRRKNSKIMQRKTLAQADGVSTTRLVEGQWWKNTLKNDDGQQEWRTNVQWHQKTRLRKKGQERRTHVGEPTKCLSKLLLLWLQFFKPCPHLWYWKLFSKWFGACKWPWKKQKIQQNEEPLARSNGGLHCTTTERSYGLIVTVSKLGGLSFIEH